MKLGITIVPLLLLLTLSLGEINSNTIDDTDYRSGNKLDDDPNPFAEAAQAFLQNGKAADIGGMIGNFMQSDEGKQLGGMLMGAALNNGGAAQLLSGLGSMLSNGDDQKASGSGFDPSILGNIVGMMADAAGKEGGKKGGNDEGPDLGNIMNMASTFLNNDGKKSDDMPDIGNILNLAGDLFQQSGMKPENAMEYLPQLLSTINAFTGPEAKQREMEHAQHAWFMPPLAEKAHIMFDHFAHSDLGRNLWRILGLEKFFNIFSKEGRFDFVKLFEMLENQSFRRHWISLVTKRITDIIAVVTDPKIHKK